MQYPGWPPEVRRDTPIAHAILRSPVDSTPKLSSLQTMPCTLGEGCKEDEQRQEGGTEGNKAKDKLLTSGSPLGSSSATEKHATESHRRLKHPGHI